jgi:hypothetical protein
MNAGYAVESDAKVMAIPNKKAKKPGFFKRWLLNSVIEAITREKDIDRDIMVSTKNRVGGLQVGPPNIDQPERAIQFTVYNASGGRVVETRRYDRQKDRHSTGLYVITSDQDFGREIDKIITMEALK